MTSANYERQLEADRLLLYGLLDRAEQIYAEILGAEPRNDEAAFGLARVALERGDDQLAFDRIKVATRLNPRNDDARRLEQRLSEILATRRAGAVTQQQPPVRPAEQATFARNRSMADHRASERKRNEE